MTVRRREAEEKPKSRTGTENREEVRKLEDWSRSLIYSRASCKEIRELEDQEG